jgi:transcriptional regulator with XRE-family HTH domain
LQGSRQTGSRTADDHDVAMACKGEMLVLAHDAKVATGGGIRIPSCSIRKEDVTVNEIEHMVRTRLRSLRMTLGLSLDELAARTNLSPSTLSRVETGKRTISLDILLPLASALQVDLDVLLDARVDDDVVIRPTVDRSAERTTWMLSRATGNTVAVKMRLEPTRAPVQQRVHPGHDWFFVIEGRVRLCLGDREIIVETGEAAEFATMTPHAVAAVDAVAELIMIFDRDGQRAHVHHQHADAAP